jgi:Domain of unknown function (DUF5655)
MRREWRASARIMKRGKPNWRCPECAREFARKSQAHSCKTVSLESHLTSSSPEVTRVYLALERLIREFGPFTAVPTQTQITLLARTTFALVTVRKQWLNLGFLLTRQIEHPRITRIEKISPRTCAHTVRLRSVRNVDSQLREWLREAYQVGKLGGRR